MKPLRFSLILPALGIMVSANTFAQSSKSILFNSSSKDKLVHRMVFSNGDYCHVREYLGEEHIGLRVVYLVTERDVSENEVKSLIIKLAKEYCSKHELPLITTAVQKFNGSNSKNSEHWHIDVPNKGYAEFFVAVDWIGESVAIQIKYYK